MSTETINETSEYNSELAELGHNSMDIAIAINNLHIRSDKVNSTFSETISRAKTVLDDNYNFEDASTAFRLSFEDLVVDFQNNYENVPHQVFIERFRYDYTSELDTEYPTDFPSLKTVVEESVENILHSVDFEDKNELRRFANIFLEETQGYI